ncbi:MAG: TonB-dependent receptor [Steroidobacteraceae bacterium]
MLTSKVGSNFYALLFAQFFTLVAFTPADAAASTADGVTSNADADEANIRAMDEIVVTAQRTTIELARTAQKEAENIVNVMAHDEIFKLPIVNSGDAVRFIPGVQLETDTGEGRFVNIRGLDSDLSSTTFGGVRLPATDVTTSPYGGGRAVSFDAIPAEMIGAVTVTKTNRPEQEAEALGGTIEITPKTVPAVGKQYFGDVRVGNGLEPLRHTHLQDYAATLGGRFGGAGSDYKPFSAIGVFSFYKDARGVDDLEEAYVDNQAGGIPDRAQIYWEQRYYKQHKKRHVYGAELGYSPNSDNKWFFRYYDFGVVQDYNRNAIYYPFSGAPTVNSDGSLTDSTGTGLAAGQFAQKYYRSTTETFDTRLAQIGGTNELDSIKLDYWIAHTQGLYNKPFDYKPIWQLSAPTSLTYNNSNSNVPGIAVTGGANPYDYTGYTLTNFSNSTQLSVTRDWQAKFNAAIPTHLTSYPTEELKFGLGARKREFDQNVTTYNASAVPALPLTPALVGPGVGYYENHYNMGPLVGTGFFNSAFANGAGAGFANSPQADLAQGALASYNVREDVYAGYGQYQFGFGKVGLFTGLRVEHTKEVFDAFAVNQNNEIAPVSSQHSYTDVLPSLQSRFEFTPSLIGRAIYSSTIGRPGYNQLSPALNINIPANLVSLGNPNLKPTHSHNIDLSIEDYLPKAGILSFGVFYKNLKDYIVPLRTTQTFPNTGIFAGITGPIPVVTFANGSSARVLGYEFAVERRFIELPGFWSGFGASANWTGVDSRIELRPGNFTQLPSTAKNTGNAALFYEQAAFNVRIAANYITRSIFAIGTSPAFDTYSESRTSLDFGSSYFLHEGVKLYLNAKNLTNTPLKYTEGLPGRPIQRETYGQTWQFGVEAAF